MGYNGAEHRVVGGFSLPSCLDCDVLLNREPLQLDGWVILRLGAVRVCSHTTSMGKPGLEVQRHLCEKDRALADTSHIVGRMETRGNRDLPVLTAIVAGYDDTGRALRASDIEDVTGFDSDTVQKALRALREVEPPFVTKMDGAWGGEILLVGAPTARHARSISALLASPTPPRLEGSLGLRLSHQRHHHEAARKGRPEKRYDDRPAREGRCLPDTNGNRHSQEHPSPVHRLPQSLTSRSRHERSFP